MNTVVEIERTISALSPSELDELYTWMDENYPIDVQLKTDLGAGRIDDRIDRALSDHRGRKHTASLTRVMIHRANADFWQEYRGPSRGRSRPRGQTICVASSQPASQIPAIQENRRAARRGDFGRPA